MKSQISFTSDTSSDQRSDSLSLPVGGSFAIWDVVVVVFHTFLCSPKGLYSDGARRCI